MCAPPEKSRRPPRPPAPVSLRRERARAYDAERRARERGVLGEVVDGNHGIGSSETISHSVTLPVVSSITIVQPVPVAVVEPFVDLTTSITNSAPVEAAAEPELLEEDVV